MLYIFRFLIIHPTNKMAIPYFIPKLQKCRQINLYVKIQF